MKVGFVNFSDEPYQVQYLMMLAEQFRTYGIELTDSRPDLILARQECLFAPHGEPWLRSGLPIVVLERTDSASLDVPSRDFLEHDSVLALFKNRTLRRSYQYNYPTASEGRYHGKLINDIARVEPMVTMPTLSRAALGKIRMVNWDIASTLCNRRYEREKAIWQHPDQFRAAAQAKDIDVIFLGTTGAYLPALNWHRQRFIEEIGALRGLNVLSEGKYPFDDYVALMRRAKVAVSPWGWGEWCWRDYEAILYGCALVKPDTDYLLSSPDIYCGDNYYRCSADAGDLSAAVNAALTDWEHEVDNRFARRRQLIEAMNVEQTVATMARTLHDIYGDWLRRRG